jgi:hypothetical protein
VTSPLKALTDIVGANGVKTAQDGDRWFLEVDGWIDVGEGHMVKFTTSATAASLSEACEQVLARVREVQGT